MIVSEFHVMNTLSRYLLLWKADVQLFSQLSLPIDSHFYPWTKNADLLMMGTLKTTVMVLKETIMVNCTC